MPSYRSLFEEKIAKYLTDNKVKFTYEPFSYKYFTKVRGTSCNKCGSDDVSKERWYTPDFVLTNGVIIEAKGNLKPGNRSAYLDVLNTSELVNRANFRILFQRNNRFGATRKRTGDRNTYEGWADKNGIICHTSALGHIPQEWVV